MFYLQSISIQSLTKRHLNIGVVDFIAQRKRLLVCINNNKIGII